MPRAAAARLATGRQRLDDLLKVCTPNPYDNVSSTNVRQREALKVSEEILDASVLLGLSDLHPKI